MEYNTEIADYNVAEFYDNFWHTLPKIVLVTQGFFGEISDDTFDRYQVLRLHTVSRQKRVVARISYGFRTMHISIPLTYGEPLCTVQKNGKQSKEMSISQLIKDNTLPLQVRFPKNKLITVGGNSISSNHIPSMELLQCFDELYLLGNLISNGVMCKEVVKLPLYLTQLRLALVTGIKGQSMEYWKDHLQELSQVCSKITYDKGFGNKDIAVYNHSAVHLDTVYAYIEPMQYVNTFTLFKDSMDAPPSDDVVGKPNAENVRSNIQTAKGEHRRQEMPQIYDNADRVVPISPTSVNRDDHNETSTAFRKRLPPNPTSDFSTIPRAVLPKAPQTTNLSQDTFIPVIPKREHKKQLVPVPVKRVVDLIYTNGVPRQEISPMMSKQTSQDMFQHLPKDSVLNLSDEQNILTYPIVENSPKANIDHLTIEDVGNCLAKLKLDKYRESFKENLIDGRMLVCMDKTLLADEFNMTILEALRLLNFAKDGHIPV